MGQAGVPSTLDTVCTGASRGWQEVCGGAAGNEL